MKTLLSYIGSVFMLAISVLLGATTGVVMADATISDLPEAGKTVNDGMSITHGEDAVPDLYLEDIDQRITKIRPMSTPIDQISRYGKTMKSEAMEVKYYSVGTRPIKSAVKTAVTKATAASITIEVDDPDMFDEADTIRVAGVKGFVDGDESKASTSDLMLIVTGTSDSGQLIVQAANGFTISGGTTGIPAIAADTKLIRLGKAGAELDAQTAIFSNIPTSEIQYCQNFMVQVEQSTFDKIADKEVNWTFTDLEEDAIYDMRLGMEGSFLFGSKSKNKHTKKKQLIWTTEGIWNQAGNDITVGTYQASGTTISDDQLVDLAKSLFTGTGVGNKRKVLFAGSDLLAAFSKVSSEKFRLMDTVEKWNLRFKSFDTEFGEVLVIHHELFDLHDMAGKGLALDPEYLTKKVFLSWTRSVLNLKEAGVRNTDATVIQEVACLYLRYAKAHARISLATA